MDNKKQRNIWNVDRDQHNFASGIFYGKWAILQLNPGTVRNEECAQSFCDMLNKKGFRFEITTIKLK